ncbi:DUF6920 family protein [Saccharospirillum impatiens]|uniref:DUF6920 family protein n=1 Tax=Saccharospirillum impatiens TaxID=169438 RepID=UPI00048A5BA2|nr:DUF6544 family protein [Saccharospirillum impatiens]
MLLKLVITVLLVLVLFVLAVFIAGRVSWHSTIESLQAQLIQAVPAMQTTVYSRGELEGLPEPVQRYFETVLTDGQRLVRHVRIKHRGTFNLGVSDDNWQPFTSQQTVSTHPRGFIWDADIRMVPGIGVCVVDAYVAGRGLLQAKLFGLITVMKQPPSAQLDQGELLRFFAESAWYPTALLPSQGVHWQAIDERRATAILSDSGTSVALTIRFNEAGLIESVRAEDRFREVNGAQIATPWEGTFWDYREQDGMLVPSSGEVAWLLPEGPKPYWRGQLTDIQYEYDGQ